MKKTIGVFEIENSLTEPIFGVVQIDVAWAERMMFLAWEAEQEGATSLNLSSSYISAEKIQAEQFSSFADAVKQAVNYIVANDVFTVRPDEETFMEYVDFEVFGDYKYSIHETTVLEMLVAVGGLNLSKIEIEPKAEDSKYSFIVAITNKTEAFNKDGLITLLIGSVYHLGLLK